MSNAQGSIFVHIYVFSGGKFSEAKLPEQKNTEILKAFGMLLPPSCLLLPRVIFWFLLLKWVPGAPETLTTSLIAWWGSSGQALPLHMELRDPPTRHGSQLSELHPDLLTQMPFQIPRQAMSPLSIREGGRAVKTIWDSIYLAQAFLNGQIGCVWVSPYRKRIPLLEVNSGWHCDIEPYSNCWTDFA